jgi:hypothetical protein
VAGRPWPPARQAGRGAPPLRDPRGARMVLDAAAEIWEDVEGRAGAKTARRQAPAPRRPPRRSRPSESPRRRGRGPRPRRRRPRSARRLRRRGPGPGAGPCQGEGQGEDQGHAQEARQGRPANPGPRPDVLHPERRRRIDAVVAEPHPHAHGGAGGAGPIPQNANAVLRTAEAFGVQESPHVVESGRMKAVRPETRRISAERRQVAGRGALAA